jgi:hypothetical protein
VDPLDRSSTNRVGTASLINGGTLIYDSQYDTDRGIVYAPRGGGVMYDENVDGGSVVLYYHYSWSSLFDSGDALN